MASSPMRVPESSTLARYRIVDGLDIFLIPNFLGGVLECNDAAGLQASLEDNYPVRRSGDKITRATVQWVEGSNDALKYRGNELKRTKIWLQRGDPEESGYAYYYYTGVQWAVVPAQTDWQRCAEVNALIAPYDRWCASVGAQAANQVIVTSYRDGDHFIGAHFDKPLTIAPSDASGGVSLITVVKMGSCARPFELYRNTKDASPPIWSQRVKPGDAIVMTLEANLETKHAVPVVKEEEVGPSGSLVFRSISKIITPAELEEKLAKSRAAKERSVRKRARS